MKISMGKKFADHICISDVKFAAGLIKSGKVITSILVPRASITDKSHPLYDFISFCIREQWRFNKDPIFGFNDDIID